LTDVVRKLFALLEARERRRFVLLAGLIVLVGFAEFLSLGAVMLVLNAISDPEQVSQMRVLGWVHDAFGFDSALAFQTALVLGTIGVIIAGLLVKAAGNYAVIRFAANCGFTIAHRMLGAYLRQPYPWILSKNPAEISRTILRECESLVEVVLAPMLRVLSNVVIALVIVLFLLSVAPLVAVLAVTLIGGGYALIYLRLRPVLNRLGDDMVRANGERFHLVQQATSGFREVKLMGLEAEFSRRFERPTRSMARAKALNQAFSDLPRHLLEAIAFSVLLGMILLLLFRNDGDVSAIVPTLGVFAFATLRILPALQQIYHSLVALQFGAAVLDHMHDEYRSIEHSMISQAPPRSRIPAMPLTRELSLSKLSYAYPTATRTALREVSLRVPARSMVGIVGGSGAGKTTLVDLILGLLLPNSGEIRVDSTPLTPDTLPAWQRTLGYVPQTIYLTDDTIAANIAFGVPAQDIDMQAVERVGRIAALHAFITTELPDGYQTRVGERGARLSGGQRQRIGIARALYHDPSLLILDEATSALDNATERSVMDAIAAIRRDRTIIIIAHRLSTVKECDTIFVMDKGSCVASGRYDELAESSDAFKRLLGAG